MKAKLVSLILILALAMSTAVGLSVVYENVKEPQGYFAVLSDLHIKAESFYDDEDSFEYYSNMDKMIHLSEAIVKSIVDDLVKQEGLEAVFVTGDMTEDGDLTSHHAARDILKRLVDNDIKVFVINGNHDGVRNPSHIGHMAMAHEIKETYWEMGYKDALVRDSNSLSYTADINDNFRVIAIDNDEYYNTETEEDKPGIDLRLIEWVKTQVRQAEEDGKTPLAIAHHPLHNHWAGAMGSVLKGVGHEPNENAANLGDALADNNCNYIFVGHMHGQSVSQYISQEGNTLYQVLTAATVYLPAAYRYLEFSEKTTKISTAYVENLNMDYVSELNSGERRQLLQNDFRSYARQHLSRGLMHSLDPERILNMIGFPDNMSALRDLLEDLMEGFINMPIYESNDYISLQEIIEIYGGQDLRQSEYENMIEIISFFVETINKGDQNVKMDSIELEIFEQAIKAVFYFLDQKSSELEEVYPESPIIDIDLEKLFGEGKLELLDSNILAFMYALIREDLPSILDNLNFNNLNNLSFLDMALPILLNDILGNTLVESILEGVGQSDIDLQMFINDVLIEKVLIDILQNPNPIDNFVEINRKTQKVIE